MKELTIEEKAQRYDEAIIEMKSIYDLAKEQGRTIDVQEFERIFPELKENEDERIRKIIKQSLKSYFEGKLSIGTNDVDYAACLSWLEKQGEKIDIANKEYWRGYLEGKQEILDKYAELEKNGEQNPNPCDGCINRNGYINCENGELREVKQKPADKVEPKIKVKYANSEYNVLEIKEIAGVTYYGIEDEPNHIDYVLPDNCEIINGYAIKENGCPYPTKPAVFSEQKPAETEKGVKRNDREIPFSEKEPYEGLTDFERTLADICIGWIGQELGWKQYIKDNADVLLKIAIKKFNSVQDAIFEKKPAELSHSKVTKISDQAQKPAEWSEEDEAGLSDALWAIQQARAIAKNENDMGNLWYAENWLKSLKDRMQPQPEQEWSKEDEKIIKDAACVILASVNTAGTKEEEERLEKLADKLQDLRPRKQWKPTEEQMEALDIAQEELCSTEYNKPICDLIDSLNKLMEE